MTKVDIVSGFLGAGKTTFIKKLIGEVFHGEKIILIENEFGEIGVDSGFLKDSGVEITEMNSGCICCTLVGDFSKALEDVINTYSPDRIIIEPSGVGKLSDVEGAVLNVKDKLDIVLDSKITVVDGKKAKMYIKNFGEFFNNQVESANVIVLSRTQMMSEDKINDCINLLKEHNEKANIITTPWDELDSDVIKNAVMKFDGENELLEEVIKKENEHRHIHGEGCGCNHEHHHEHNHECCEHSNKHEGHHHKDCECNHEHKHEHHHHNEHHECSHEHHHDHTCSCGCGHHHHDADEVFSSFGMETVHKYSKDELNDILEQLADGSTFGVILRAKGVVNGESGIWYEFDLVPGEYEIRERKADYTGKICVIGTDLKKEELNKLFGC